MDSTTVFQLVIIFWYESIVGNSVNSKYDCLASCDKLL